MANIAFLTSCRLSQGNDLGNCSTPSLDYNVQATISQLQEMSRRADNHILSVQDLMLDQVWHPCQ